MASVFATKALQANSAFTTRHMDSSTLHLDRIITSDGNKINVNDLLDIENDNDLYVKTETFEETVETLQEAIDNNTESIDLNSSYVQNLSIKQTEMNDRVETVENNLTKTSSDLLETMQEIDRMQKDLDDQDSRIGDVENDLETTVENIKTLQNTSVDHESRIQTLESSTGGGSSGDYSILERKIESVNEATIANKESIERLSSSISDNYNSISNLYGYVNENMNNISSLESSVNTNSANISSIQNRADNLKLNGNNVQSMTVEHIVGNSSKADYQVEFKTISEMYTAIEELVQFVYLTTYTNRENIEILNENINKIYSAVQNVCSPSKLTELKKYPEGE